MPFNGSGTFSLIYNWQNDAAQGINISSSRMMGQENDIASALSDCVTRDGQSPMSADLPMGGHRLTNMAAASAQGNAISVSDMQNGTVTTLTTLSGTDTIIANTAPAIAAYATGQAFDFIPTGANTTAAVTLNINGLGAINVTKFGTVPLAIGDLQPLVSYRVRYDGTQFQVISPLPTQASSQTGPDWNVLLNPDFRFWETGTSFSLLTSGTYAADIWVGACGTAGAANIQRGALSVGDPNSYSRYFLQFNQTTAAGAAPQLLQRVESVNTLSGQYVTLEVIAGVSSGTLVITPTLAQNFGSGGSPSSTVVTTMPSITLTTAEAVYRSTVFLPSVGGKTVGTNLNDYLAINLNFPLAQTFTATFFRIRLGAGTSPQPYQQRPFNVEMQSIQRYIEVIDTSTVGNYPSQRGYPANNFTSAQAPICYVPFKATKRIAPTVTAPSGTGNVRYVSSVGVFTGNNPSFAAINTEGFNISCSSTPAAAYGFMDGFGPVYADSRI